MPSYEPPVNKHYTQANTSDIPEEVMWKFVGKEGNRLKRITASLNLDYVYYHGDGAGGFISIHGGWGPVAKGEAARKIEAMARRFYAKIMSEDPQVSQEV
jgi:hypothetical protein